MSLDKEIKMVNKATQWKYNFSNSKFCMLHIWFKGRLCDWSRFCNGPLAIYLKVNPTAHRTPLMVSKQHEEQSCLPSLRLHFFFSAVASKPTKTITKHKTVAKNNAYKWITHDISLPLHWISWNKHNLHSYWLARLHTRPLYVIFF